MEAAAHRDPLTGLWNRRMLDKVLARSMANGSGCGPLSIVVGDLDHFKRINDTFGHPVGDEVLRQVAAVLKDSTREADCAARVGGEEFVVVSATDETQSLLLCERIRASVQILDWSAIAEDLAVTMSLGVATWSPTSGTPPDTQRLLEAADRALYRAKEQGRNRAVRA
jgi:diguanylate cyclase